MAIGIDVRADVKATLKGLKRMHRRQIPFATSQALNDTAKEVKDELVKEYFRVFTVRNKNLPRIMWRLKFANKRNLEVMIFDRLKRAFVPLQALGGAKTPHRSSTLAIPTRKVTRIGSGKLSARFRPGHIKKSFKGDPFGRGQGIWQRYYEGRGKNRVEKIRLIHHLEKSAKIDAVYDIWRVGEQVTRRRFYRHLQRRIKQAIATAR